MNLSVLERLKLLDLLPSEGNIGEIRIVRELREMLEPDDEDEQRGLKIEVTDDGNIKFDWGDATGGWERPYEFSHKQHSIVARSLEELNKHRTLTEGHISLYEKFVEE
jgi:hypothetical protein